MSIASHSHHLCLERGEGGLIHWGCSKIVSSMVCFIILPIGDSVCPSPPTHLVAVSFIHIYLSNCAKNSPSNYLGIYICKLRLSILTIAFVDNLLTLLALSGQLYRAMTNDPLNATMTNIFQNDKMFRLWWTKFSDNVMLMSGRHVQTPTQCFPMMTSTYSSPYQLLMGITPDGLTKVGQKLAPHDLNNDNTFYDSEWL